MLYDILLNAGESPWAKAVGAALGSAILGIIWYMIETLRDKNKVQKQAKKIDEEKAEAFIKSDRHGNGDYNIYLIDELLDKCHPKNFMDPYDYEKVRIANELYPRLLKYEGNNNDELVQIRKEATSKLGIVLSTNSIFEELCKTCNPQQFMNPYNPDKVAKANELYSRVLQNKTDIDALEKIRDEVRILFDNTQEITQQENEHHSQISSSNDYKVETQAKTQQSNAHISHKSSSNDFSAETPIVVLVVILIIALMVAMAIKYQTS